MSVAEKGTDLFLNARMSECCTIVKRPFGLRLGPGMELMHRPPGHAMPAGVKLVPLAAYPEALRANPSIIHSMSDNHVELIRLPVHLDLPETCSDDVYAFPRPQGMRLPPNVGLYACKGPVWPWQCSCFQLFTCCSNANIPTEWLYLPTSLLQK